jgi:hypothetical protein
LFVFLFPPGNKKRAGPPLLRLREIPAASPYSELMHARRHFL